jgi:O-6-methylguanine DNA methyltransferase
MLPLSECWLGPDTAVESQRGRVGVEAASGRKEAVPVQENRGEGSSGPRRVDLHAREVGGKWFGLACVGTALAATAVESTRGKALESLQRGLPSGVACRVAGDDRSEHVDRTIAMLVELEAGHEENKQFSLAQDYVAEPLAAILRVASAIPIGYVTTYGEIARVSGTEARDVGSAMARNPLYPIVPCHRVVGAGFALVGYAGSRGAAALRAKLDRLSKEARGLRAERDVAAEGGPLRVYPVERAIAQAEKRGLGETRQRPLFE